MKWNEVRAAFPNQWIIVEALETHVADGRQYWDTVAVVERSDDGNRGLRRSGALNRANPGRLYCCFHTRVEEVFVLASDEWPGIRWGHAIDAAV